MNSAPYERVNRSYITAGTVILFIIMAIGFIAAMQRYVLGLGAATNLTNEYPWGIWIAFDILCGVALAAGGFTVAAAVYVFGGKKYHSLVRPAVLTALLGYLFVAVGLLVDLGLPWHIWHPIIFWPRHSAMFEVAWCVMLYLTVLALEFAPAVFARFGWQELHKVWNILVPWYSVVALTFFTFIMSHSWIATLVALVVLSILALVLPAAIRSRPGVPILLIMAGILFSTAHQSSLGSLFLLMPDKLSKLWYSPMLPVNFFLTAVAVGFGMVIFEATFAAKAFDRPLEKEALAGLGRICAWVLWIYLIVRLIDVAIQGGYTSFAANGGLLFTIELLLGVIIPALLLSSAAVRHSTGWLFISGLLVVIGVVINRFNVALGGMNMEVVGESGPAYFPSVQELLITAGIVAAIMFFYNIAVKMFPVFEREEKSLPTN